ncbi:MULTISPECIES: hypothetical protein [Nocardiaceae]|uniref:hypothetical protein n=1 Tax=Nocardiaceae TaxID=85025 RepID=UPI00113FFDED|nr:MULTISPECIES: hypothetical protein [Rhodococcus]
MASPSWWGAHLERYSALPDVPDVAAGSVASVQVMEPQASNLVALRTSVHGLRRITPRASVFDDLADVCGLVEKVGGALPTDFARMLSILAPA